MTLRIGDRAKETALAPGTGDVSLGGAVTGFTTISAITGMGNGDTTYYTISDGGANWEVGLGTYVLAGNKLQRTTILRSSSSNAAVNFTNPITVWGDAPASKLSLYNSAGDLALAAAAAMLIGGAPSGNSQLALLTAQAVVGYFNSTHANGSETIWANNGTTNGRVGSAKSLTGGTLGDFGIDATGNLIFSHAGTEVARVDTSGNLLVGVLSGVGSLANGHGISAGLFTTAIDAPAIPDGGDTTVQYSNVLAPFGAYLVTATIGGTGGAGSVCGVVQCGDPNMRPGVFVYNDLSYNFPAGPFSVHLQTMNSGAQFGFGDGLSFQLVFSNTAGTGTIAGNVRIIRIA